MPILDWFMVSPGDKKRAALTTANQKALIDAEYAQRLRNAYADSAIRLREQEAADAYGDNKMLEHLRLLGESQGIAPEQARINAQKQLAEIKANPALLQAAEAAFFRDFRQGGQPMAKELGSSTVDAGLAEQNANRLQAINAAARASGRAGFEKEIGQGEGYNATQQNRVFQQTTANDLAQLQNDYQNIPAKDTLSRALMEQQTTAAKDATAQTKGSTFERSQANLARLDAEIARGKEEQQRAMANINAKVPEAAARNAFAGDTFQAGLNENLDPKMIAEAQKQKALADIATQQLVTKAPWLSTVPPTLMQTAGEPTKTAQSAVDALMTPYAPKSTAVPYGTPAWEYRKRLQQQGQPRIVTHGGL